MSPENNGCGERAKGNNVFAMITMIKMMNMMSHESRWLISHQNGGESGWILTTSQSTEETMNGPSYTTPQPTWLESETKSAFSKFELHLLFHFREEAQSVMGAAALCHQSMSIK